MLKTIILVSRESGPTGDIFKHTPYNITMYHYKETEHESAWIVSCREVFHSAKSGLSFL